MADTKATIEITAIDSATRVFNQVNASAKSLEKQYSSLASTFETVVGALAIDKIVADTVAWEQASNRLNSVLKATGNAAGFTRQQLDQMADSLSQSTPFNEQDIRNAEANLLKFGNIHDQVFSEALKLSADYAAFTGGSVTEATQAIGRALADPVNGLKALQREFGNLTFAQKQYIAQLEAAGKTEQAQVFVLDILRNRIGGTASGSNTGITAAVGELGKAWDKLVDKIGNTDLVKNMAGGAAALFSDVAGQLGSHSPADTWSQAFEQQAQDQAQLVSQLKKTQEAQDRQNEARAKAVPIITQWNRLLQDQTNEQRALNFVLEGEGRTLADVYKAQILNIAVEADWRRVAKDRMDLAAREATALAEFRDGTLSEEENLATRVKVIQDQWMKGTRDTFQDYILHAKDGAEQARFFFTNTFRSMEDGLVQFAMTGKANFHDFARSVIADLVRIFVRQQLAGFASSSSVAGAAGAFGGSLFGFGTTAPAIETHTGGVVGQTAKVRNVDPAVFAGAPRMHMGGLAGDEVPAILQRGERVIPKGGSMGHTFNQKFYVGGNVTKADLVATAAAARTGTLAALAEVKRRDPNGVFG